jgi:predicted ATPase/DNA-binding SARP family transcriptional activator
VASPPPWHLLCERVGNVSRGTKGTAKRVPGLWTDHRPRISPVTTIGVLGQVRVGVGAEEHAVSGHAGRLLAALVLYRLRGRSVDRHQLIEVLWPDHPPTTANSALHVHLSRVRRELDGGSATVVRDGVGYRLEVADEEVDLLAFLAEADRARALLASGEAHGAVEVLDKALGRWSGRPFEPFDDEELFATAAHELAAARADAEDDLIAAWLAAGVGRAPLPKLRSLADAEPLRERRWVALATAMAGRGQRTDALRACESARRHLAEVGLEISEELRNLQHRLLVDGPTDPLPQVPASGNLAAPLVELVGRDSELDELGELLSTSRLLTLHGPPGVGKSTLARTVGDRYRDRFPDGVWDVDLSVVDQGSLVASAVAEVLGVRAGEQGDGGVISRVVQRLAGRSTLVVLDNCEHVAEAVVELIAPVLAAVRDVRVITTSRVVLGLPGEHVVTLRPLGVPARTDDADTARDAPAVQLLERCVTRAGAECPNHDVMAALARRLDGLPLGIELVAGWLRTLPGDVLLDLLDEDPSSSSAQWIEGPPALQQTLERSVDRLSDTAVRVYRCMGVLAGAADLEAIAAVSDFPADVLPAALRELVDASLIVADRHGAAVRYRMLFVVREDAGARLRGLEGEAGARARHTEHFRSRIGSLWRRICSPEAEAALVALDPLVPDVRRALHAAIEERDLDAATDLGCGLHHYLAERGTHEERRFWLEQVAAVALEQSGHPRAPMALALSVLASGTLAQAWNARDRAEQALVLSGDADPETKALVGAAVVLARGWRHDDLEGFVALCEQAREWARQAGLVEYEAVALRTAGLMCAMLRDSARGIPMIEQAVALLRRRGSPSALGASLMHLGLAHYAAADHDSSQSAMTETAAVCAGCGNRRDELHARMLLTRIAVERGDAPADLDEQIRWLIEQFALVGDRGCKASAMRVLATTPLARGDRAGRSRLLLDARAEALEAGNHGEVAVCHIYLAELLAEGGDHVGAARLLGPIASIAARGGVAPARDDRRVLREVRRRIDEAIGEERHRQEAVRGAETDASGVLAALESRG